MEDRIRRIADSLRDVPPDMPRLLMSHDPDVAEIKRMRNARPRIDLMIAGHMHGSQVRLPGLGTPIIPSRFGQKYASGLVQGPMFPAYISRGSAPPPSCRSASASRRRSR
jgi:predicted MPP superfamily phosphohydrolase